MTNDSQNLMVSVIIVSWNTRDYLEQCLASLTEDACQYPMEIIVVDNASTDGSPDYVQARFPRVRMIRNDCNQGFAKANNIGIRKSRGKYICLVNSDVTVLKGCITKLVEHLETHPSVGMVGPSMIGRTGELGRSCRGFPTVWNLLCHAVGADLVLAKVPFFSSYTLRYWPQNTTRNVDILGGWFLALRREAVNQVGLLDEKFFFYAEDMDWCKRFHVKGFGVVFLSTAAAIHYGGGSSQSAPIQYYIQQQRADRQYWRKHHSKLEEMAYFYICIVHQATRLVGHTMMLLFSPKNAHRIQGIRLRWHCLLWYLSGAS